MEWIRTMNAAIDYIENNLDGEIDLKEVSQLAKCSNYHFQRVFSYMAGVTLSEYIRRRRLTKAAFDLQGGDEKVIDIAIKYGYDSPTAFTRAFQGIHGMSPSEAKTSGKVFTAYPPISFQITIKGVTAMNYRIESKEAIRIVGAKLKTTMENEEAWKAIPGFWGEMSQSGMVGKVGELINKEPFGVLGVSVGDWHKVLEFDYYIAAATDKEVPQGMEEYTIPASTWAIFECTGSMPEAIQNLQQKIVTEWLPTSGYSYGEAPDIEVYTGGDNTKADYKSYVWLPIIKK